MLKGLKKYNIPDYTLDLIIHFNMIYSLYQINLFYLGIITQSFFILMNYKIYGNWKFKNSI